MIIPTTYHIEYIYFFSCTLRPQRIHIWSIYSLVFVQQYDCLIISEVVNPARVTRLTDAYMLYCLTKLTIIVSDNGLLPDWCQVITRTNDILLSIGPWGQIPAIFLIKVQPFSSQEVISKCRLQNGNNFVYTLVCYLTARSFFGTIQRSPTLCLFWSWYLIIWNPLGMFLGGHWTQWNLAVSINLFFPIESVCDFNLTQRVTLTLILTLNDNECQKTCMLRNTFH